MADISKDDLFDVIRHGYIWHSVKIKDHLSQVLASSANQFNHDFRYDSEDNYYYIYDNECYIFVFDGKIEVRCDRDNTFSANKSFTYQINDAKDIIAAIPALLFL